MSLGFQTELNGEMPEINVDGGSETTTIVDTEVTKMVSVGADGQEEVVVCSQEEVHMEFKGHDEQTNLISVGADGSEGTNFISVDANGSEETNLISVGADGSEGANLISVGADGSEGTNLISVGADGSEGKNLISVGADVSQESNLISVGADGSEGTNLISVDANGPESAAVTLAPSVEMKANITGLETSDKPSETEDKDAIVVQVGEDKKEDEDKKDEGDEKKEDEDTEVIIQTKETKVQVNGTKSPKKQKQKKESKPSNPNSPAKKILRFFRCGSGSPDKAETDIEGDKASIFVTNPNVDETCPSAVDFGLDIVSKVEVESEVSTAHHYVGRVKSHGLADQFGLMVGDELLFLNFFPILGKSQPDIVKLFEEEEIGRKTILFFRRYHDSAKKRFDYHYTTGTMELKQKPVKPEGEEKSEKPEKPRKCEYTVVHLSHQIINAASTELSDTILPSRPVCVNNHEFTQDYFAFDDNNISVETDFSKTSKFIYELVNVIVLSPPKVEAFFRHKIEDSTDFMFLSQIENEEKMGLKEEPVSGVLPVTVLESEKLVMTGISLKSRLYAFESITNPGHFISVNDKDVVMTALPEGKTIQESDIHQFFVLDADAE